MTEKEVKEQVDAKAKELSESLKVQVHPIVFNAGDDDWVIGYLKEPTRQVKLAVLDKSIMGGFSAAGEALDAIIIKDQSDARLTSERSEDDKFYLGAVMAAYDLIKYSANVFKKK